MSRSDTTIKAILFDLDGTLIDTDDHMVKLLTHRLTPLARLLSFDASDLAGRIMMWAETPGNTLVTFPDKVGLDDSVFAISDILHRWRGLYPRHTVPSRWAISRSSGQRPTNPFLGLNQCNPLAGNGWPC